MVGLDVEDLTDLAGAFAGLYFETGQGSAVTNGAAEGVDMVTLESRAYGLARYIRQQVAQSSGAAPWMIVNDVAGFIGPEVFTRGEQLERVCLEDSVMAKLHGLTMGLDVCATFHMGITPRELDELTQRIVIRAAPAYLMAVAGSADPMLGYLTTSFRQHPQLRRHCGRDMSTAMRNRLTTLGAIGSDATPHADATTVDAFTRCTPRRGRPAHCWNTRTRGSATPGEAARQWFRRRHQRRDSRADAARRLVRQRPQCLECRHRRGVDSRRHSECLARQHASAAIATTISLIQRLASVSAKKMCARFDGSDQALHRRSCCSSCRTD